MGYDGSAVYYYLSHVRIVPRSLPWYSCPRYHRHRILNVRIWRLSNGRVQLHFDSLRHLRRLGFCASLPSDLSSLLLFPKCMAAFRYTTNAPPLRLVYKRCGTWVILSHSVLGDGSGTVADIYTS